MKNKSMIEIYYNSTSLIATAMRLQNIVTGGNRPREISDMLRQIEQHVGEKYIRPAGHYGVCGVLVRLGCQQQDDADLLFELEFVGRQIDRQVLHTNNVYNRTYDAYVADREAHYVAVNDSNLHPIYFALLVRYEAVYYTIEQHYSHAIAV